MEYDVVIVGAGPAGLASAIRLKKNSPDTRICILEKGARVGAHILSGALFDPRALYELFPHWLEMNTPVEQSVLNDEVFWLKNEKSFIKIPSVLSPPSLKNEGCYIISLAQLCIWLGDQAQSLGIDIFPGFCAKSLLIENNQVQGVLTGEMGLMADGSGQANTVPSMAMRAKYTVLAEGARGHLGKQAIKTFNLESQQPPHYALGFKEVWQVPHNTPGRVIHGSGWPLYPETQGGFYLYHAPANKIYLGLIVDLNYKNPWLDPFMEFQRMKHNPLIAQQLAGGERIAYGARAINKGGFFSLPRMDFPGGFLIGCNAGTFNTSRLKGSHTAIKSGIIAADYIASCLNGSIEHTQTRQQFSGAIRATWLYQELYNTRNFNGAIHRLGTLTGGFYNLVEQALFRSSSPFNLYDPLPDHRSLKPAEACAPIAYPKPDKKISFDKASSVYLANTQHRETQPCHLKLHDPDRPTTQHLTTWQEPAQRYCPAGVFEIIQENNTPKFHINAANCIHCKTCDIKDPSQNIEWTTPEGGSGPNYTQT